MIITLILLIILILGKFMSQSDSWDGLGIIVVFFSFVALLLHIPSICFTEYAYEMLLAERNSLQESIAYTRSHYRDLEGAAILQSISVWNAELAQLQYMNDTWFFDQYIDDRIMDITPIR